MASFEGAPRMGTAPVVVSFSDTSTGEPTAWSWDFGDGQTSTERHPVHTYLRPGIYDVALTVTNVGGSNTLTLPAFVIAERGPVRVPQLPGNGGSRSTPPSASFAATPRTGRAPLVVSFADTSAGGATSWLWEFGDGSTSTANHPIHVFQEPGSYDVSLTVTNPLGSRRVTYTAFVVVRTRSIRGPASPGNGGSLDAPR